MTTLTMEPVDTARLEQECARTRAGRRLARILHTHEGEVATLLLVHPDVRLHVHEALVQMNRMATDGAIDSAGVAAMATTLDDFDRLGGMELRSTVACLREDLSAARGRSLTEVLGA